MRHRPRHELADEIFINIVSFIPEAGPSYEEHPLRRFVEADVPVVHHRPPGGPQELVALSGASPPFLRVEPILAMARHMVERLTETPLMASTYSQRSLSVANSRSFRD